MRYPLVDGQGNFGSVDGDAPAAMRYTEARLSAVAEELLADIDKETVDFVDNFDGSLKEPAVLPASLPNLLLNGASGIAVGMATNVPPHNLAEVNAALAYLLDHYETIDDVTVEDLMAFIPGPDFPTGGVIVGREGIVQAYSSGRGHLTVRGVARIEERRPSYPSLIITEIPFQVNKSSLIERIAEVVREGKIEDIADLRDESDRHGMSIVVELKRGADARRVLRLLYRFTSLQVTYGVRMLALVEGEPHTLSLKRMLQVYIEHRRDVIRRRSEFELENLRKRAHILEGLLIALANLDAVIQTIRESRDADQAKTRLMKGFGLDAVQAQAILDLQLRRLAALERHKIEQEQKETLQRIGVLEDLLAHPKKVLHVIKEELAATTQKYGDDRRTRIVEEDGEVVTEEMLIPDEPVLVSLTQRGYVKRTALGDYRTQNRARHGVIGQAVRGEDEVLLLIPTRTRETMLFFSDRGKVYAAHAHELPEGSRTDRGLPIQNVLSLGTGERITAVVPVADFDGANYCVMATRRGKVKRVALSEFANVRNAGLIAITLEEGDELAWAQPSSGQDDVVLVSAGGYALRFHESEIRPSGRNAMGVQGIALHEGDSVASMALAEPGGELLVVSEKGFGKRTTLEDYATKGRANQGVTTIDQKVTGAIGKIAAACVVQEADEVTLISTGGVTLRLKAKDVKRSARATKGVKLMNLSEGDSVVALARLKAEAVG